MMSDKEFEKAVNIVTKRLLNQDSDIRRVYHACLTMAFYDEWRRHTGSYKAKLDKFNLSTDHLITKQYKNNHDVHTIASRAADQFLTQWCKKCQ